MPQTNSNQFFYIYNEDGTRLGVKDRFAVHRDGDWHRGVQLNLMCDNLILMQLRSSQVDIAKGLLDQSLATQLIVDDKEDDMTALSRGLREELGLHSSLLKIEHVAGPKKISKRYSYDATLYNREFVTLYQAYFPRQEMKPVNRKVQSLLWKPIDEIKDEANAHPEAFTQTFLMWLKEVM